MKRLNKQERHIRILGELRARQAIRVSDIARHLGVHVETVRRDLNELHKRGMVNRTYGGAAAAPMAFEPTLAERDSLLVAERSRMGELAVDLIDPGDAVMVDVGSTTTHFARRLAANPKKITIITNAYSIAIVLGGVSQVRVVMCPGEYSAIQGGVSGPDTIEFLGRFHANKAIISAGGLTPDGPSEFDPDFAWVKRAMLAHAQRRILLIDRSKYGRVMLDRICNLDVLDHLIVDERPGGELLKAVQGNSLRLHVAT